MPAFEYRALAETGREVTGIEEGDTARQVRQSLREQGLVPISVDPIKERGSRTSKSGSAIPAMRGGGISATDLALLTRQLATLTQSAIPLEEALATVANQSEKHRIKRLLLAIRSRVLEGYGLADGLQLFPSVFSDLYRSTVAAGERSGYIDKVLERLADYTERRQQLRQKVQLALLYPAILSLVALAVTVGLLTYVVPQVVEVFTNIDQQLPTLTRVLIAISNFLLDYGIELLLAISILTYGTNRLLRLPLISMQWHRILHRIPLIGRMMRGLNSARFARTLSILGGSGVPVLEAMGIAASVVSSRPMRQSVEKAIEQVREGVGIARALEREGGFPPIMMQLIASGESGGNIDEMLERAAENQERELETMIAALMGIFEPLLIVVMGGMVMVIVLAILLPVFELNQLVS